MKSPRVAFVGAGNMAQRAHLRSYCALARTGACELVGLLERRPRLASWVAEAYGIRHIYASIEDLLADPDIDGIVAVLPYRQHAFVVPQLLSRGIPVFTEKPLALSVESGQRLAELGMQHHTPHMVGYHKRSDPAVHYAREVITRWREAGDAGAMRYVRVTMPPGNWTSGSLPAISTDEAAVYDRLDIPADVPDGAVEAYDGFVNYYIHQVNLIRFLLGEPYRVRFADRTGHLLVGESAGGVTVTLEMAPFELGEGWWESVLIGFDRAFIEIRLPAPLAETPGQIRTVREIAGSVVEEIPQLPPVPAMRQQAATFLEVIQGSRRPPCDAAEAVEDLKIARAFFQLAGSAATDI